MPRLEICSQHISKGEHESSIEKVSAEQTLIPEKQPWCLSANARSACSGDRYDRIVLLNKYIKTPR